MGGSMMYLYIHITLPQNSTLLVQSSSSVGSAVFSIVALLGSVK